MFGTIPEHPCEPPHRQLAISRKTHCDGAVILHWAASCLRVEQIPHSNSPICVTGSRVNESEKGLAQNRYRMWYLRDDPLTSRRTLSCFG